MPTITEPPDYKVCKEYLDFVVNTWDFLEKPYGFLHVDKQVYSRLLRLIWKHKDLYANVTPILRIGRVLSTKSYTDRKYCTNAISAWGTKTGLLIQRLLHQDQWNMVLKDGIIFGLSVGRNCLTKSRITQ